jgi:hypothetical protein
MSYEDHFYELYTTKLNYKESMAVAETKVNACGSPAYLTVITSAGENAAVYKMLSTAPANYNDRERLSYIGLHDQNHEMQFEWINGEKYQYSSWSKHEPNDYKGVEDCVHTGWKGAALWNDVNCDYEQYFILEYDCDPGMTSTTKKFCHGPRSKWTGDPHITTFDGLYYDCQGKGEFVMQRSTGTTPFKFHARFVEVELRPSVSVTRGVAFAPSPGSTKIAATTKNYPNQSPSGECEFEVYFDDTLADIDIMMNGGSKKDVSVSISKKGRHKYMTVWYHKLGHRFVVSVWGNSYWGCVMNVDTCLHEDELDESYAGLIGTPDNKFSNEWTKPDGQSVSIPGGWRRLYKPAFDYCTQNWCVGAFDQSLFEDDLDTFKKFNECPAESVPYPESPTPDVEEGKTPCVYNDEAEKIVRENNDNDKETPLKKMCTELSETKEGTAKTALFWSCITDGVIAEDIDPENGALDFVDVLEEEAEVIDDIAPPTFPGEEDDGDDGDDGDDEPVDTVPLAIIWGDPHVKTWAGESYDFHGVCDLVMLQNPQFSNGLGMDVHIRTKQTKSWSYVSAAALRIGSQTLEVMGGKLERGSTTRYWLDGVEGAKLDDISDFSISYEKINSYQHRYEVMLTKGSILIETFKEMVRVNFHKISSNDFDTSLGLLGSYGKGAKIGRDKVTLIEDVNEFGQMWQVLPSEDMLFHNVEGPQAPEKCMIPDVSSVRRRLSESSISERDAKAACAGVNPSDFDMCVFDVMATNDLDVPGSY